MVDSSTSRSLTAVDPALGYLYQVRSALLWALQRLKGDSAFLVSIETLDDVNFETSGGHITDLIQTKHHRAQIASLSDGSSDLWRTLKIWFEGSASGKIPRDARLFLVTTGAAPTGSAASRLLAGESREIAAAQTSLDAISASSTNLTNKDAYLAYLNVPISKRGAILERVIIIDASPTIVDLDRKLRQEVYWAVKKEHHVAFLQRLEGWWLRRVLQQLVNAPHDRIGSVELEAQMADLREQFKQDALPIDEDIVNFTLDEATKIAHKHSTFVRQMEIIDAGKRRIAAAIRDYYRAFEQRSRWLRDDLIVGMDLDKYEKRLIEEWELVFEATRDELGGAAADAAKQKAARSVLAWAERASILIRPRVTEPFITRGSLHLLSNETRIGWHPEFRERLAAILTAQEASP